MKSSPVLNEGKAKRVKSLRVRVGVFAVLVVLAIAAIASIALPRTSSQASPKKYRATKEVVRDQATGALRLPTPTETDAMVSQISVLTNRSSDGLTVNTSAKGMKTVNLEGRSNAVTLGRANADGTTEIRCVFSVEEAAEFLGLEQE